MTPKQPVVVNGLLLTDNESLVLAHLMLGLNYQQINHCTHLSVKTMRNMVSNLYTRLEVHTINALTRLLQLAGFDLYGYYKGTDLLGEWQRKILYRCFPHLIHEHRTP